MSYRKTARKSFASFTKCSAKTLLQARMFVPLPLPYAADWVPGYKRRVERLYPQTNVRREALCLRRSNKTNISYRNIVSRPCTTLLLARVLSLKISTVHCHLFHTVTISLLFCSSFLLSLIAESSAASHHQRKAMTQPRLPSKWTGSV